MMDRYNFSQYCIVIGAYLNFGAKSPPAQEFFIAL